MQVAFISLIVTDFILGTVHKSKGLEFDTVVVTDDFMNVPCARHNLQRVGGFNAGLCYFIEKSFFTFNFYLKR